jgi:hypothetical protein
MILLAAAVGFLLVSPTVTLFLTIAAVAVALMGPEPEGNRP